VILLQDSSVSASNGDIQFETIDDSVPATNSLDITASGDITFNASIGSTIRPLNLNLDAATMTQAGAAVDVLIAGSLAIDTGTYTISTDRIIDVDQNISGTGILASTAAAVINVGQSFEPAAFSAGSLSTVTLDEGTDGDIRDYVFWNLTFGKNIPGATVTSTVGGLTVSGMLTMSQGIWIAGDFTHQIAHDWDSSAANFTFTSNNGTIVLQSPGSSIPVNISTKAIGTDPFYDLSIINNATMLDDLDVSRNLTLVDVTSPGEVGTLTTGNYQMNVGQDYVLESNCTFNAGSSHIGVIRDLTVAVNGNLNADTSSISIGRDTLFLGNFNEGTSTLIFNGDAAQVLTTGGIGTNPVYNMEINAAGTVLSLGSDLEIDNEMLITAGIFQPGNYAIQMDGTQFNNNTGNANAFDHVTGGGADSRVTFTNPGTTQIWGTNQFYEFWCIIEGAELEFEDGETQTITGEFHVDGQIPPVGPPQSNQVSLLSTSFGNQWIIDIQGIAFVVDAYVQDSFAVVTITPDPACTDGGNNTNWYFYIRIDESFTEDTDGNGKIDRIRVRVLDGIILSEGTPFNPSLVTAEVHDYTVVSITSADRMVTHEFFINLQEHYNPDTDAEIVWKLIDNNPGGIYGTVGGALVEYGDPAPWVTTTDRAAPIINTTLTVANGRNEIYVRFSEMVRQYGGAPIDAGDFQYNGASAAVTGLTRLTTSGNGTSEALLILSAQIPADEVITQDTIQVVNNLDDMTTVVFPDNPPAPEDPPLATGTTYRVSDLALGIIGNGAMEPVFASNTGVSDQGGSTVGVLTDFTGEDFLQVQDIYLESHIHNNISASAVNPNTDIVYAVDVPGSYLSDGLWLPTAGVDNVFYLVDQRYPGFDAYSQAGTGPVNTQLRGYEIPGDAPQLNNNSDFDFFFRFKPGGMVPDMLYGARVLDESSVTWYQEVRPWTFMLRNVVTQAGNISILNNIINPLRNEVTSLHYTLDKGGIVSIQVFDLAGGMVEILERGYQAAGEYAVSWNGRNRSGNVVARGIYFIRFVGPGGIDQIRKVLVVK